jgi:hypothetical protein
MMIDTLPKVVHEHHDALLPHVDALADIADKIGKIPTDELEKLVATEHVFVVTQLVPHMEHAEGAVYPQLERLFQNRHSMTPMRKEHGYLRRYVDEIGELRGHLGGFGAQLRLRRVLYRMFALMKTHLAEEEAYIAVLERNLSPAELEEIAHGLEHATAD